MFSSVMFQIRFLGIVSANGGFIVGFFEGCVRYENLAVIS